MALLPAGVNSLSWEVKSLTGLSRFPLSGFSCALLLEQHWWHLVLAEAGCSGLIYWVRSRAVHSELSVQEGSRPEASELPAGTWCDFVQSCTVFGVGAQLSLHVDAEFMLHRTCPSLAGVMLLTIFQGCFHP